MSEGMRQPTEAELAAAYEEQLKQIRVEDVVAQTVVSLLNLGARKAGLGAAPPGPGEPASPPPDLEQLRQAIEGARALLPLLESRHAAQLGPVRETVSRLQMAYAQLAGEAGAAAPPPPGSGPAQPAPDPARQQPPAPGTGEAQRSGRLWIPGQ